MNPFRFDIVLTNFARNELNLARKISAAQRSHALKAFKTQTWEGKPWKQVERRVPGTDEYKYPAKKGLSRRIKPILQLKGELRRDVNNARREVTRKYVRIVVDNAYAQIHNEGGRTWNGGKIAKRQFIGWPVSLRKIIKEIIEDHITQNFNT